MALSNWDLLAINHEGNPTNGVIRSKMGVEIEIYKNWLYINDKVAWQKGQYSKPVVGEIHSGIIQYKDTIIYTQRGPQQGVYCIVCTPPWPNSKKADEFNVMIGIGCYGYKDSAWIGIQPESVEFLKYIVINNEEYQLAAYSEILKNIDFKKMVRFNQGDNYFANKLGLDTPTSKVGKSAEPMLTKILK